MNRFTFILRHQVLICLMLFSGMALAQTIPFEFKNTSPFKDDEIYVAIVGKNMSGAHIWVNCKNGAQLPMSSSYNTVDGPVYNGNKGPGGNAKYANCFTRLSEVPNKTVALASIQGCRAYIAKGSQLYFYFFGSTGAPSGYSSPSHTDPTDPNKGIVYEVIELTYDQYGFWGNTTRVDSYNYAMGLELFGNNGFYKKTGELKSHSEIGSIFLSSVPTEFKGCYNPATGAITFPTKTAAFADGSVGTMPTPGPYVNYMKPYIDAIWEKYKNEDLMFSSGDAGVWKGRVNGSDQLVMVCQNGGFAGRRGIIERRPTTQEAFEGKGVLDRVIQDGTTDLLVQAQICAAITRHVINTTTPNPGLQNWSDPSKYYITPPYNYYTKFWHQQSISEGGLSYGFAYDDVFDQSSTLHTPSPTKVVAHFGGFATGVVITQKPYNGIAQAIPGTIQAEYYDEGGQNVSWFDVDGGNTGGAFRATDVDMEACTDAGTGHNVGWTAANEWLEYTANVAATATYSIDFRVASPNAGKQLRLEIDGIKIATIDVPNTGGWQNWQTKTVSGINITKGTHLLRVFCVTDGFNFNWMKFSTAGNQAPTVAITSPVNNAAFNAPATITITTSAKDADGTISKVEFYNGSTLIGDTKTAPYSFTWTGVAAGTYALTAVAIDDKALSTRSAIVTVKVNGVIVNNPPTVALTSPGNNSSFTAPATVNIAANAGDDGGVSKVEFFNGGALLYSDNSSPYAYSWTNVAAGTYTIVAKATDNTGLTSSTSVTITVTAVNTGCSAAQYTENGGYVAGSKVKNAGRVYECKPWPYSGWCNGAAWAYAPGAGAYWTDAWTDIGACAARTADDNQSLAATVLLSPNPASSELRISLPEGMENASYSMVDAMGKEVLAGSAAENIDVHNLKQGIYTVIILQENSVVRKQFVKN